MWLLARFGIPESSTALLHRTLNHGLVQVVAVATARVTVGVRPVSGEYPLPLPFTCITGALSLERSRQSYPSVSGGKILVPEQPGAIETIVELAPGDMW